MKILQHIPHYFLIPNFFTLDTNDEYGKLRSCAAPPGLLFSLADFKTLTICPISFCSIVFTVLAGFSPPKLGPQKWAREHFYHLPGESKILFLIRCSISPTIIRKCYHRFIGSFLHFLIEF